MATNLVPFLSAAGTRDFVLTIDDLPANIIAKSLGAAETVAVNVSIDSGANFITAYQGGSAVTLSSTDNVKTVNAPGWYQVSKGVTAAPAGVYIAKGKKPETL